jgi:hypothetical protein
MIIFILEQGEEVAEAYTNNWLKSLNDELRPRSNFKWANAADCLREERQISIKMLLKNIHGIDTELAKLFLSHYKLISQLIHGSSFGNSMSFNGDMSEEINDLKAKHADYYTGGISTVISNTMLLLFQTYKVYFSIFPDGGLGIKKIWIALQKEYVKVFTESDLWKI